jgi:hypothetical protein
VPPVTFVISVTTVNARNHLAAQSCAQRSLKSLSFSLSRQLRAVADHRAGRAFMLPLDGAPRRP